MHTHNTLPNTSQKYHVPIWKLPSLKNMDRSDQNTVLLNKDSYIATKENYKYFAKDVILRAKASKGTD